MTEPMEIFLVTAPGLEEVLAAEARAAGFSVTGTLPGGVTLTGGWPEIWRANRTLRGATRVLARLGSFRALHLAQLDKRARKFPWAETLRPDVPVRIETTCRKSRIYHAKAATQRIARAITEELGAPIAEDAPVTIKARIEDDLCTFSVDTSGPSLHKRGHKAEVNKAPMRETLAALFLCAAGYDGTMPVYDPMCGSGTFVIEAAEWAAGLLPGRSRSFAFEHLASFEPGALAAPVQEVEQTSLRFTGSDRDAGAIRMSTANAARAGVADLCAWHTRAIGEMTPPEGPPGLVITNPPYGARIGNRKLLFGLYATLGARLSEAFAGWRVGIVTADAGLAKASGLPLTAGPLVPHGGLKVRLYTAGPL